MLKEKAAELFQAGKDQASEVTNEFGSQTEGVVGQAEGAVAENTQNLSESAQDTVTQATNDLPTGAADIAQSTEGAVGDVVNDAVDRGTGTEGTAQR